MYDSKWNDCEREHYEKFAKTDEGLAYTIAMEMYHARIADERMKAEKAQIADAMRSISDGIRTLEKDHGIQHSRQERERLDERKRGQSRH